MNGNVRRPGSDPTRALVLDHEPELPPRVPLIDGVVPVVDPAREPLPPLSAMLWPERFA
jgi:hypothetical protein